MLQEITLRTFCSRAYSLASLFGVLLILKFFDRMGINLVAALARVSVECTYIGFLLLLFFLSILCNKPVHLSSFSVYGNFSPKTLNYQLHHNYGSRTDICSFDSMLLVSWKVKTI